ncbi:MAG TPA: dienelactone hydrolase family protein [Candidatus Binatia bacterium]|nr:dienelactone hydrolase family protein [Candidatus Binatia bacterium]
MKALLMSVVVFALTTSTFAAEGKPVSYKSGDETVNGILYTPQGKGPFPALVVIHEWWGLNDWVKEQASKLADQGYVALAIDLYRGKVATTSDEAHQIMRGVPSDRANRDLLAAGAYLRSLTNVNPTLVGDIGWCMGGGYALDLAIADPKLKVAVINYGHLATDDASLKKINAAILGIFGGQDKGITPADVNKFESQLKALGKTVEIHSFPNAGHAFQNPNDQRYRADDAAEAWKLTVAFLAKYLR